MAELYVVDAHALIELQAMRLPRQTLNQVLEEMTELVRQQKLCFPGPVMKFCKKFACDEVVTVWVNAVAGHRRKKTVDAEYQTQVLDICDEIADPDDPDESASAPLFVAAMSLELCSTCDDVAIVTEDRRTQPTRMCLVEACDLLGLPTIKLGEFLSAEITASL